MCNRLVVCTKVSAFNRPLRGHGRDLFCLLEFMSRIHCLTPLFQIDVLDRYTVIEQKRLVL